MRTGAAVSTAFAAFVFLPALPGGVCAEGPQQPVRARKVARHFPDRPPIDFAFEPEAARGPRVIITNLYQEPLTAFIVQTESKSAELPPQTLPWDALQSSFAPIARGLSLIQSIPRVVGGPVPEAKLVAALWEDGSTFGSEEMLQRIHADRRTLAEFFDRAVRLLEKGLEQRWTQEEYMKALDRELEMSDGRRGLNAAAMMVRSNLQGRMKVNGQPAPLDFAVRKLIDICRERRDSLKAGMPAAN